ncbi:MAG: AbrB/MazE/SpoVT family DNA-binding domain-containing protein [Methanobacteriota archaeon]|jgi:AbrB family looped-hinge helix DNA binding protein
MKTKISKGYQVVVPAEVREKFGLEPGDMLLWEKKNDEVVVKPRKRARLEDIMGIISVKANAVELKKKAQRGEL